MGRPSGDQALNEANQRRFYELDRESLGRLVSRMAEEELSVVSGGILEEFERSMAEFFGARHCVATINGTASLHLALFAIDLKPGDEVLMPTYGYYAFAIPVCVMGGVPVFCDIEPDTLAIDPGDARRRITSRTRAILAHQPWGCPADAWALRALADEHDLALMADASHAIGALFNGRPLGELYDFVCTSLGKGKLLSGGELGAVTANSDRHRDRMLLYGHVNRVPKGLITDEYRHLTNSVGIKYRPHPFAMALALSQLTTYPERSAKLVGNVRRFEAGLAKIDGFLPHPTPAAATRVYWRVTFRIDPAVFPDQAAVIDALRDRGAPVEKHRGAPLIHEHSVITEYWGVATDGEFPVARDAHAGTVQIPVFAFYDDDAVERILAEFTEVAREL